MSSKKKANTGGLTIIDLTDDDLVYSGGLAHLYQANGTCITALTMHKTLDVPKIMAPPPVDPSSTPLSCVVPLLSDAKQNLASIVGVKLLNISWQGVLVAGGSVLAALSGLNKSTLWKNSDVDIFLYGLSQSEMRVKIKMLWTVLSGGLPKGGCCFKTPHTLSFVFPGKDGREKSYVIQVICRMFSSPREILEAFDVACCAVCFDGANFLGLPRAIEAIATRTNLTADLTRRSYNFETRLIKYARRGFAVGCPGFDRDKAEIREPSDWEGYGRGANWIPSAEDYYASSGLRKLMLAEWTRNTTAYFGPKESATKFLLQGEAKDMQHAVRLLQGDSSRKKAKGDYGDLLQDEYPPDMSWAVAAGLGPTPFNVASTPAAFLDEGHAHSIKSFPVGPFPRASGSAESQHLAWVGNIYKNRRLAEAKGVTALPWPDAAAKKAARPRGTSDF